MTQAELLFDGATYDAARDGKRLGGQLERVRWALTSDGRWWTLRELADAVHGSEAGVSARLRDLRKPKFGGHTIARRYLLNGQWQYRMVSR